MRPLCLKGHSRPITRVRPNSDGDLLLSTAKDKIACLWYSENGERVGTYTGHNGAVWDVDVTHDSEFVITGSADNHCMLWQTETGKRLNDLEALTPVKCVGFSYSGNLFFYIATARMGRPGKLCIFDIRDPDQIKDNNPGITVLQDKTANAAVWSYLDDKIVSGHENGHLYQYDLKNPSEPSNFNNQEHRHEIRDVQVSEDQSMLITASKDKTARLWDAQTLNPLKLYKAERPVNSGTIAPGYDHVVIGGGEEAMQVTQKTQTGGHFEAKFYHLIFEEEYARIKGHFGPINSLCYLPSGDTIVTGGEDGYIRIQTLDDDLKNFSMDY